MGNPLPNLPSIPRPAGACANIPAMSTPISKSTDDFRHLLVVVPVAILLFALGIGSYDIWPPDEPRFAQVAREMLDSGHYIALTVNDQTYLEKPPLLFWSMAAFGHLFGDVTEHAARLPSVIAGVFSVTLTYLLAARMFGARVGLWSALILMTTFRFWWQARTGQTDMLLSACVTGSMYCLWRWDEARRGAWLLLAYAFLAAGLLTKGPPALVFVLAGTLFFYRGEPFSRKATHWVVGTLVALFVVALWYIPARLLGHEDTGTQVQTGIWENLFRNTIGRLFLGVSKAQPPWYYLETIPVDLAPWTLFLPWAVYKTWRERNDNRAMRFLFLWTAPALIFFSLSIGKRATYILPLFPIFAIFMARGVLDFMDSDRAVWQRRLNWIWAGLLGVGGIAVAIAPQLTIDGLRVPEEHVRRLYLFAALLLISALYALFRQRFSQRSPFHRVVFVQMALVFCAAIGAVFPVINVFQSAKVFCAPLRFLVDEGEHFRLYSIGFTREAYVYYAKHSHHPVLTDLIGVEGLSGEALYDAARAQKRAHELLQDAVAEVPIARLGEVQPQEVTALHDAIEKAITEAGDEAASARKVEGQLREVLRGFVATFQTDSPAYFFVQEEDWRWLLALEPAFQQMPVIREQRVGSREVLLVGNTAGQALLARLSRAAALS